MSPCSERLLVGTAGAAGDTALMRRTAPRAGGRRGFMLRGLQDHWSIMVAPCGDTGRQSVISGVRGAAQVPRD